LTTNWRNFFVFVASTTFLAKKGSGILPTGERVAAQQSHWFRVAEGKVAEH
jgi:hypothetical protein